MVRVFGTDYVQIEPVRNYRKFFRLVQSRSIRFWNIFIFTAYLFQNRLSGMIIRSNQVIQVCCVAYLFRFGGTDTQLGSTSSESSKQIHHKHRHASSPPPWRASAAYLYRLCSTCSLVHLPVPCA